MAEVCGEVVSVLLRNFWKFRFSGSTLVLMKQNLQRLNLGNKLSGWYSPKFGNQRDFGGTKLVCYSAETLQSSKLKQAIRKVCHVQRNKRVVVGVVLGILELINMYSSGRGTLHIRNMILRFNNCQKSLGSNVLPEARLLELSVLNSSYNSC